MGFGALESKYADRYRRGVNRLPQRVRGVMLRHGLRRDQDRHLVRPSVYQWETQSALKELRSRG